MARHKKILVGDVFSFEITDEIMEKLKVHPPAHYKIIMDVYNSLKFKRGYCIVVKIKDEFVLIESKRVDVEKPTIEQIKNGKTISISWTSQYALSAKEYKNLGNIPIESKNIKNFWSVAGKDFNDFLLGKSVDINIKEVEGDYSIKFIRTTRDINVIKELYRYIGANTFITIILEYLLRYNRDKDNINSLKW